MALTLYHNPRCSKSREALRLLQDRGACFTLVEYLKAPPDPATLSRLIAGLDRPAADLVRTGDAAFAELGLETDHLDGERVVILLAEHPTLMQRPLVSDGERTRIGRPPETVLDLVEGS